MLKSWYKTAQETPIIEEKGDAFESAINYMLNGSMLQNRSNLVLVHGKVTGQGPIRGVVYLHAWVEDGDEVIDVSDGKNAKMSKFLYYSIGNIKDTYKYTVDVMINNILKFKTMGPWKNENRR